ncbi:MAG: MFS transporter, partial [Pelistega sp.]|nr:MFS transporter [Pelistega sp.]
MDLRLKIADSPMSGYQWLVVSLAVLLNILDGFDVLTIAFTAKSISSELGLQPAHIGTLMSAGFIGMALGSFFLAPFADKFGRRPLLILSTALAALGMLMTYFCSGLESIAFWRVVTGLGVGGILPCTNVIVSEYSNKKWRGLAIAIYAAGFGIGATLGGMSAILLQEAYGWRSVFLTGAVLTGLAFIAIVAFLPESVDYLITKRPKQALAKLHAIALKINKPGEWSLVEQASSQQKASVLRLFEKNNLKTTLLIWLSFIGVMSSFYFVSSWTPALLESTGMSKTHSQSVGMAISLGGTIGSLIFGFLVSKWSAKSTLIAFTLLSALAVILFVKSSVLAVAIGLAIVVGALMNGCIT